MEIRFNPTWKPGNRETLTPTTLGQELRWCADLGMFALDRPIAASCAHQTPFCRSECFNGKLYDLYQLGPKDQRNESAWLANNVTSLSVSLSRKRHQTNRARFMTRGEALKDSADIPRIRAICEATPNTVWWLPTRSWHNRKLWRRIEAAGLRDIPNLRILASIDPSDRMPDLDWIAAKGLSTMYFGDNGEAFRVHPILGQWFRCPKTWAHVKGACSKCKRGCFNRSRPVRVHLKKH